MWKGSLTNLIVSGKFILTCSCEIQKENVVLYIPYFKLRDTRLWVITMERETKTLVRNLPKTFIAGAKEVISCKGEKGRYSILRRKRSRKNNVNHNSNL